MSDKKIDVLVAGEINPDLILHGDVEPIFGQFEKLVDMVDLTIGSSSVIFACGLAKLGLNVSFIGYVGDDVFGHFMLEEMINKGIDISNVIISSKLQTGLSVILNRDEDRAILTFLGAINELKEIDISDDLLKRSIHLHVASYFLQTKLRKNVDILFSRANNLGLTTSLDTNWDPEEKWIGLDDVLKHTNIFLPNEKEAASIIGSNNISRNLTELQKNCSIVAIKNGGDGSIAKNDKEICEVDAMKMQVVDTIGAGDSFNAGFVFGFLEKWSLKKCLQFASVCGSLSTQGSGGIQSQPDFNFALNKMEEYYE